MLKSIYSYITTLSHIILFPLVSYIILFSNDLITLTVLALILIGILIVNYILDACPISLIEEKYHNNSSLNIAFSTILNIDKERYHKHMLSRVTIEIIWISILLTIEKILTLLLFRKFILKYIQ